MPEKNYGASALHDRVRDVLGEKWKKAIDVSLGNAEGVKNSQIMNMLLVEILANLQKLNDNTLINHTSVEQSFVQIKSLLQDSGNPTVNIPASSTVSTIIKATIASDSKKG